MDGTIPAQKGQPSNSVPEEPKSASGSAPHPMPDRAAVPPLPGAVAFLGMGLSAAACLAIPVAIGVLFDDKLHTSPLCLVIGLVLGVAAAAASVITMIRRVL